MGLTYNNGWWLLETVLAAEAVLRLQLGAALLRQAEVVAAMGRSLAARRQQVDEAVAGLAALAAAHGAHRARRGHVRRTLAVGLIQLADQPPLLRRLGHALHVGVQRGQRLV